MTLSRDEHSMIRVTYRADNVRATGFQLCPVVLMTGNVPVFVQLKYATLHAHLADFNGSGDLSQTLTYSHSCIILLFVTATSSSILS